MGISKGMSMGSSPPILLKVPPPGLLYPEHHPWSRSWMPTQARSSPKISQRCWREQKPQRECWGGLTACWRPGWCPHA